MGSDRGDGTTAPNRATTHKSQNPGPTDDGPFRRLKGYGKYLSLFAMARRGRHPPHRLCSPQAKEKSVCTNGPVNQTVILAGIGTTGLSRIRQTHRRRRGSSLRPSYRAWEQGGA